MPSARRSRGRRYTILTMNKLANSRLTRLLDDTLARDGRLSAETLAHAARQAGVPLSEAWGVVRFFPRYAVGQPLRKLGLIDDPVARTRDFTKLSQALSRAASAAGLAAEQLTHYPSLGLEAFAPAAVVEDQGRLLAYPKVDEQKLEALVRGEPSGEPMETLPPELAVERGRLLGPPGEGSDLASYQANGGYAVYGRLVRGVAGAESLFDEVEASGLLGRGGAAFPLARKLRAVHAAKAIEKYVVMNGDESEPGNFKDRWLMEHRPHLVLEGLMMAAVAVGAERAFAYVRGEYQAALNALKAAVRELEEAGFLGRGVLGANVNLSVEVVRGGGLYICGEETALLESIEGHRAEPRIKPPFPTEAGLFGAPTLINNVETLSLLPLTVREGGVNMRRTMPKLFSLSGDLPRPGLYELPLGSSLGEVLGMAGAEGASLKAVLLGGAAGTFIPMTPEYLKMSLDFAVPAETGDALGAGAVVALARDRDLWEVAEGLAQFFVHESCGKCFPCSLGTERQLTLLREWRVQGLGPLDRARFSDLSLTLRKGSLCGLGQAAPWALGSLLERFPHEGGDRV